MFKVEVGGGGGGGIFAWWICSSCEWFFASSSSSLFLLLSFNPPPFTESLVIEQETLTKSFKLSRKVVAANYLLPTLISSWNNFTFAYFSIYLCIDSSNRSPAICRFPSLVVVVVVAVVIVLVHIHKVKFFFFF